MIRKNIRVVFFSIASFLGAFIAFSIINEDQFYIPQTEHRHQFFNHKIPTHHLFAGELVHFKNPKAYGYYNRELQSNAQRNSSARLLLKNAAIWLPVFERMLTQQGIPEDFKYIPIVESGLQNVYSPKGAVGFWQLKENTAIELGLIVNAEVDERLHPIRSTQAAIRFFKQAYKEFGTWTLAAASYNRGMGGMQRAMDKQGVNDFYDLDLNRETASYIYRLLAVKDVMEHPNKYGLKMYRWNRPAVQSIVVKESVSDLKTWAAKHNVRYDVVKEYNPWLIGESLTLEKGKSFTIELPLKMTSPASDSIFVELDKLDKQEE
ncbi:MAG: lytic transglycosylase domain-containing protein [Cytophagaceae bacterium]|jgi:hypothetical protein|nr:lytic transglycosylase domain-containing protein [Cytophagaceae bacterium]